jgi:threonine/homoserine efflux transporter RhtA
MVGPICLVQGLSLLSAGSASLLLNLEAVFTLLIAVLIGREHLSRKGLIAAVLILSGAVLLTEGSLHGATLQGTVLIAGACLAWGIDNNLSQRLSLRDPLQIALLKAIGASAPMVLLALAAGQSLPDWPALLGLVAIGALGYGLSIWLDLLALRHLGAAREALVFSTTPFVGLLFSLLVLREAFTSAMAMASAAMPCCSRKTIPTGIAMTRSAMRIVTGTIQPAATPTTATTTPGMSSSQTPPRRPFGMPMSISTHLLSTSTPTSVMFITAIVIAMNLESLCYA